jgi:membrane protease YdiL (CAAX protease family)
MSERKSDALVAFIGWSAWCALPGLLACALAAERAALVAFGGFAALLLATRRRPLVSRRRAAACVACALAACAGAVAQPAWLRMTAWAGTALGLAPAPLPAAAPRPAAAPELWLAAGLAAPLAEELLYRERLLRALRCAGPAAAVALTSALFALPHREPWWMLGALLFGGWLGALALASRGVGLCVGYHAGFNLACLSAGMPIRPRALCCAAALAGSALAFGALRAARAPRAAAPACALALVLVAGSAAALVVDWSGELALEPLHAALPAARIDGTGVATLNGSAAGAALVTLSLAGGITGSDIVPVTDPIVSNGGLVALRFAGRLGAGALRPFQPAATFSTPQLSAGALAFHGDARMCLITWGCNAGLELPLHGGATPSSVGLGVGGMLAIHPSFTLRHSVLGAPWTPRTALLTVPTSGGATATAFASGFAHGPLSFTGSTALPGGAASLVTPLVVRDGSGIAGPTGFARLTLHFVPEPGALLVLPPSIALLAAGARRRRRRRESP